MSLPRVNTVLAAFASLIVIFFGLNFLLNGEGAAAGFGIAHWPQGDAAGYYVVKGVRDLATGAVGLLLLGMKQRRVLSWVTLINAFIPIGDGIAVATHGGTIATATMIHWSAATLVLITSGLLFWEQRRANAPKDVEAR